MLLVALVFTTFETFVKTFIAVLAIPVRLLVWIAGKVAGGVNLQYRASQSLTEPNLYYLDPIADSVTDDELWESVKQVIPQPFEIDILITDILATPDLKAAIWTASQGEIVRSEKDSSQPEEKLIKLKYDKRGRVCLPLNGKLYEIELE